MAVTVTPTVQKRCGFIGGQRANIVDLALSGTYATNGVSITAAQCGLSSLTNIIPMNSSGFLADWVASTSKLKLFYPVTAHTHAVALDGGASAAPSATGNFPAQSAITLGMNAISKGATKFVGLAPGTDYAAANTAGILPFIVPAAGTLRALYAWCDTAPTSGKSVAVTVNKNTVDGALTCTIADTAAAASDTTGGHAMDVAAGDQIVLKIVETGTGSETGVAVSLLYEVTAGATGIPAATHTHGAGTLVDAASGAATPAIATEVTNAANIGTPTIRVLALGV